MSVNDYLPMPDTPSNAVAHTASLSALAGAITGWLPHLAVLLPMVYYGLLIWESKTVQEWRKRRRLIKLVRKAIRKRRDGPSA